MHAITENMKKVCEICGGTGQISSFKGASRFLLSWDECPHCSGIGYVWREDADPGSDRQKGTDSSGSEK